MMGTQRFGWERGALRLIPISHQVVVVAITSKAHDWQPFDQ
jgi:hypothetical protein